MNTYKILEINLDEVITGGDACGTITLEDRETGEIHENSIWYDEDGEHYFCFDTGETDDDGEEILDDMLISDVSMGDIIG